MTTVNSKRSWIQEKDEPLEDCKVKKIAKKGGSRENSHSRKKSRVNKRDGSNDGGHKWPPKKHVELETDTSVLVRRQKQIDYGKNTVGYNNYLTQVPLDKRTKDHPKTPDKFTKYSRRSWDKLIEIWRKKLHHYDTGSDAGEDNIVVIDEDYDSDSE